MPKCAVLSKRGSPDWSSALTANDTLGELVGLRRDLPGSLLQELLRRATEAVMKKILSLVPPERRQEIERVIAKIGRTLGRNGGPDYSDAERNVAALVKSGKLE